MASEPSTPRGPSPPRRPPRAYARVRGGIWVAATLCGGLVLVLLFFATIGVIDFYEAPVLGIVALGMTLFWLVTMWTAARARRGTTARSHDRERRGF
jgi:hypothetical protein